jgi:glutamate N-acetyltransferase / amino-acid N-acetyltransferase
MASPPSEATACPREYISPTCKPSNRLTRLSNPIFDAPPRFPRGFRCAARNCGIKPEGRDLTVFHSEVSAAATALFTRNQFPGAPVLVGRARIKAGRLQAIVINSKVSNVGTGELGIQNALRMAAATAQSLGVPEPEVLMSSTGVIGVPLPIEKIERGLAGIAVELQDNPLIGAEGIMTTDSHPKALSCRVGNATITIVAKGSGMIEPNLATMLAYIFTDARWSAAELTPMLEQAVDVSLNMLSVDTDTSTSDTCVLMANGLAGAVDRGAFMEALTAICIRMAEILARDGEGATKLLRVNVRGAASQTEARRIAKSIVNSPLIKTMAYGADPNVGRILMAVGKCFDCTIDRDRFNAEINGTPVIRAGARADFDDPELRSRLAGDPVEITVDLQLGDGSATAFGCDLTDGYIRENASYYSS